VYDSGRLPWVGTVATRQGIHTKDAVHGRCGSKRDGGGRCSRGGWPLIGPPKGGPKGVASGELIIGEIRYSFSGRCKDLGGFSPTYGQDQGESCQIFLAISVGKENAKLWNITHPHPDAVKTIGNVDIG
jgi:hypothetical protein